jgi:hypothetical protein
MLSRLKPNMARAPLLLVVIFVVLAYRCSSDTSAEDRMIDWVRQAGGEVGGFISLSPPHVLHCVTMHGTMIQVNVEVATVDGLRGTAVTKDIPEGGTIAFVPQKLMYIACSNKDDPLVVRICSWVCRVQLEWLGLSAALLWARQRAGLVSPHWGHQHHPAIRIRPCLSNGQACTTHALKHGCLDCFCCCHCRPQPPS